MDAGWKAARATGLFRERFISLLVAVGILAVTFSVLDHWYGLFTALFPLGCGLIAAAPILEDRPKGYIQRVALAILAFTLFGVCLGHLGYFANDRQFRPILFWLVVTAAGSIASTASSSSPPRSSTSSATFAVSASISRSAF